MKTYRFGKSTANCPHIDEIIQDIASIVTRLGASAVYLFGSHIKGKADRYSDVDLLVIIDDVDSIERHRNEFSHFQAIIDIKAITPSEFDKIEQMRQHWLHSAFKGWRLDEVN